VWLQSYTKKTRKGTAAKEVAKKRVEKGTEDDGSLFDIVRSNKTALSVSQDGFHLNSVKMIGLGCSQRACLRAMNISINTKLAHLLKDVLSCMNILLHCRI